jgi:hypothetical protein
VITPDTVALAVGDVIATVEAWCRVQAQAAGESAYSCRFGVARSGTAVDADFVDRAFPVIAGLILSDEQRTDIITYTAGWGLRAGHGIKTDPLVL